MWSPTFVKSLPQRNTIHKIKCLIYILYIYWKRKLLVKRQASVESMYCVSLITWNEPTSLSIFDIPNAQICVVPNSLVQYISSIIIMSKLDHSYRFLVLVLSNRKYLLNHESCDEFELLLCYIIESIVSIANNWSGFFFIFRYNNTYRDIVVNKKWAYATDINR